MAGREKRMTRIEDGLGSKRKGIRKRIIEKENDRNQYRTMLKSLGKIVDKLYIPMFL